MSLDVSPTAIADIRKGVGPAGREPQTVMEVRDSSFQSRSVAHLSPDPDPTRHPARTSQQRASARGTEPATRRAEIRGVSRRFLDGR